MKNLAASKATGMNKIPAIYEVFQQIYKCLRGNALLFEFLTVVSDLNMELMTMR